MDIRPTPPPASAVALDRPGAYATGREAARHAAAFPDPETPALRRALRRLDFLIGPGQPPKAEVPRGYYFNAVV